MQHYVCDKCGNYWRAHSATTCPACKYDAIWEFDADNEANAKAHAQHIARGNASGLFRVVAP